MPRSTPTLALVAALLAAGLAGCLSDEPAATTPAAQAGPDEPSPASDPATDDATQGDPGTANETAGGAVVAPRVDVTFLNGTITGVSPTVADVFCCLWLKVDGDNTDGRFEATDAAGLVVELHWTDTVADLDLGLVAPDYEEHLPPRLNGTTPEFSNGHIWLAFEGRTGAPDQHARIVVTEPEALALPGEWAWWVGTKAGHAVPFTAAVSVFYGEPPTGSYSALASS